MNKVSWNDKKLLKSTFSFLMLEGSILGIAENSLNGIFVKKHINDVKELDSHILNELKDIDVELNIRRKKGKKIKYPLEKIAEYDGYLLTSFTKFNYDNKANLDLKEYIIHLFFHIKEIIIVLI